jgi:hypothetical protein
VLTTATVLAAPAVSSSYGGRGSYSSCGSYNGCSGRVAQAGGLVSKFSSLYLLLLTTHMLIFAYKVCSGALPVLGRADASYCYSLLAIS